VGILPFVFCLQTPAGGACLRLPLLLPLPQILPLGAWNFFRSRFTGHRSCDHRSISALGLRRHFAVCVTFTTFCLGYAFPGSLRSFLVCIRSFADLGATCRSLPPFLTVPFSGISPFYGLFCVFSSFLELVLRLFLFVTFLQTASLIRAFHVRFPTINFLTVPSLYTRSLRLRFLGSDTFCSCCSFWAIF